RSPARCSPSTPLVPAESTGRRQAELSIRGSISAFSSWRGFLFIYFLGGLASGELGESAGSVSGPPAFHQSAVGRPLHFRRTAAALRIGKRTTWMERASGRPVHGIGKITGQTRLGDVQLRRDTQGGIQQ